MWWLSLAILGTGVGLLAGLYGVGGGFLLTPLLMTAFGLPQPVAAGTGLCQMIGTAVAALLRHRRLRQGEFKIDVIMLAGSLIGVQEGARLARFLAASHASVGSAVTVSPASLAISGAYIGLLVFIAVGMLRESVPSPGGAPLARVPLPPYTMLPKTGIRVSIPLIAYLGLALGFLSGLLGIGGGVVLVPILVYGLGVPLRAVAGTGILLLLATALGGTATYAGGGLVRMDVALVLLAGSTIGAQVGASLVSRLEGRWMRHVFVALVLAAALAIVWDLARRML